MYNIIQLYVKNRSLACKKWHSNVRGRQGWHRVAKGVIQRTYGSCINSYECSHDKSIRGYFFIRTVTDKKLFLLWIAQYSSRHKIIPYFTQPFNKSICFIPSITTQRLISENTRYDTVNKPKPENQIWALHNFLTLRKNFTWIQINDVCSYRILCVCFVVASLALYLCDDSFVRAYEFSVECRGASNLIPSICFF